MTYPKVMDHIKPAHIECSKDKIAPMVIMPGDPLRAKYIAEKYLTDYELVSDARNMYAYTGYYKNQRVTVMGSGMGMPSMSIYAFELFYFAYSYNGDPTHIAYPSPKINQQILEVAQEKNYLIHQGTVMCTQQFGFYSDKEHVLKRVPDNIDIIAEEMESFALFHIANSFNKESAVILTVVDSKFKDTFMSIEDRERSLDQMITLALDSIIL